MHEIVTLQFGRRANYLGTHFWNTQESYFTYDPSEPPSIVNHDVNFRSGVGTDGSDTYTPRALVYDLKRDFGSLRKVNALYDTVEDTQPVSAWDGVQQIQTAPPVTPSPYQIALEGGLPTPRLRSTDIRYWSDYNRVYFHPRSLVQLPTQSLTAQLAAFESHAAGNELFRDLDQEIGGLLDRDLRLFVEECDSLQGFQIFGSSDDAWGGFMSRYVEDIKEEFGKKSLWVWGIEEGQKTDRSRHYTRLANSAHTLTSLADSASAYLRLSTVPSRQPDYTNIEASSDWVTTALLAAAIESATLPTRLRSSPAVRTSNIPWYEDCLSQGSNRGVWTLQATVGLDSNSSAGDGDNKEEVPGKGAHHDNRVNNFNQRDLDPRNGEDLQPFSFDIDFTPVLPSVPSSLPSLQRSSTSMSGGHVFAQVVCNRHSQTSNLESTSNKDRDRSGGAVTATTSARRQYDGDTVVELYNTPLAFPIVDSFPNNLFRFSAPTVTSASQISSHPSNHGKTKGISIRTGVCTTSKTKIDLLALRDLVVGRAARSMGLVAVDEREAMYDELTRMSEEYTFGYEDDAENGVDDDGVDDDF